MMKKYMVARRDENLADVVAEYLKLNPSSHEFYVSASWAESAGERAVCITDDTPPPAQSSPRPSSRWTKKDPPARAITR